MNVPMTIVFAGGGTGGHLFPGLAIAEALQSKVPAARISFAGSRDKIEATVVPRHGYEFDPVWISGFRRRLSLSTFVFPLKVAVSLWQARGIIRRRRPDVVVGTGGYVSGPVVYMAARMGVPTLIQEQNEYPGVTTRLLAKRADEVHITFEETRAHIADARVVHVTGNPVRSSLRRLPTANARRVWGLDPDRPVLFVFGGSLGASSINTAVGGMLRSLDEQGVQVLWQTGARDAQAARDAAAGSAHVVVREFIHEMDAAYSAATLVLCRAGATSLAELTVLGLPSVLVPYPHAAADHQRRNARALENAGAARVVEDGQARTLGAVVLELLRDQDALRRMSEAAARLGRPDAASCIADAVIRLAGTKTGRR